MKRFKYQGLVTLVPSSSGDAVLPGPACRMVVRARHRETGQSRLFNALVTADQGIPQPDSHHILVTMTLAGDDAGDCLAPGEQFTLWREGPAGDGVVTRRLFV